MAKKFERRELLAERDRARASLQAGVSSYGLSRLRELEKRLVDEQGYEWALDGSGVAVPQGMGRSANVQPPDAGAVSCLRPDDAVREAECFRIGGIRKGRTGMELGIGASQAPSIGSADSSTAPTVASNAGAAAEEWGDFGSATTSTSSTLASMGATLPAPPVHPHIKTTPMRAAATTSTSSKQDTAADVLHSTSALPLAQEPTSAGSFLMHPLTGLAAALGSIVHRAPGLVVPVSMKPVSPADALLAASAAATAGPSRVVVSPLAVATPFPTAVRSGAAHTMTKSASATTPLVASAAQSSTVVSTVASATTPVPGAQVLPSIGTLMQGLAPPGTPPAGASLSKL